MTSTKDFSMKGTENLLLVMGNDQRTVPKINDPFDKSSRVWDEHWVSHSIMVVETSRVMVLSLDRRN